MITVILAMLTRISILFIFGAVEIALSYISYQEGHRTLAAINLGLSFCFFYLSFDSVKILAEWINKGV